MKPMLRRNKIKRRETDFVNLKAGTRIIRIQQRSQQIIRVMRMRWIDVRDAAEEIMSLLIVHGILVLVLAVDRKDIKL